MTTLIQKRFLQKGDPDGRRKAGILLSVIGVLLNLMLFIVKLIGGRLSGSVAVTADGFNHLADTFSCIVTLSGFVMAGKKPNKRYPMGYGRLEYLSGLLISGAVLFIGGRMLVSSAEKILHPQPVTSSTAVIAILLLSILVKWGMYRCYTAVGGLIGSSCLKAAALDSLSDCCATLAILVATAIEKLTGFIADGWTGVAVALCILYAGVTSVKESAAPLLGRGIDAAAMQTLEEIIRSHKEIRRTEQPMLHDYGPGKRVLTIYLETDHAETLIPILRQEIIHRLGMEAVVCPLFPEQKNESKQNKGARVCQQYLQNEQTQEREASEHQTR